jgi:hypothetical protein
MVESLRLPETQRKRLRTSSARENVKGKIKKRKAQPLVNRNEESKNKECGGLKIIQKAIPRLNQLTVKFIHCLKKSSRYQTHQNPNHGMRRQELCHIMRPVLDTVHFKGLQRSAKAMDRGIHVRLVDPVTGVQPGPQSHDRTLSIGDLAVDK